MNRRQRVGLATIVAMSTALELGCGSARAPSRPETSAATHAASASAAGRWSWSHREQRGGVRIVEREYWQLTAAGNRLAGTTTQIVTALSLTGVPFTCNQQLSYEVVTTVEVTGRASGQRIELSESDANVSGRLCAPKLRRRVTYRGSLAADGRSLRLTWDGGQQVLTRAASEYTPPQLADQAPDVSGAWLWTNRVRDLARGVTVFERESWRLAPTRALDFAGDYTRVVTEVSDDGSALPCWNAPHATFIDRYEVIGTRRPSGQLYVREVRAAPDTAPCIGYTERHLDSGNGFVEGTHLVIDWRGGRRQVLRRPPMYGELTPE